MAREKNITASPLFSELFHLGLYKPSQGKMVRRVTWAALAIAVLVGAWRLSIVLSQKGDVLKFAVPTLVAAAGVWIAFRAVNMPRFADFLIAVEAELNKVSWPSRGELIRSTIVVLFTIIVLTVVLYGYDILWSLLLRALGVIEEVKVNNLPQ
jgi:preprotein translocase subunit SecE